MSDVTYRHQLPFSTLAVAEALNPTLYEGEPWTEKDPVTGHSTGRRKVGDGVTAFIDLPFEPSAASSTASSVTFSPAGTIAATNVQAAVQEVATDAAAALVAHEAAADPHAQYLTQTEGDARYRQSSTALTDSDIPAGIARDSEVSAAITAHESASDPHPQYLTQTEGDGRYRQTATALTDSDIPAGIARDSEVTAAISAHEAAADPHPGYLTQAEGDGRYRQTATALTDSDIPAGIARDSEVTAAITAHEGAADPHPVYLTAAEGNAAYGPALTTNAAVTAGTNAQGSGVLTADVNVITSTPNNPSGVTLPTATVNDPPVVIVNRGTNPVNVYPASGAQIDVAGTNNPYSLAVGARFDVIATSATQWQSSSVERTSVSFLAGTGTGVNTALAVNVGSAGAVLVNGGVLGTPSSGTLTNCTGLPAAGVTGLGSLATLSALGSITSAGAIGSTANLPIITTTGGVLSAGSFGTAANTFCQGNDSRLSDARTPLSHTHGNISNAGAIGSTANLPIITGTSGVLQAGSFGTAANTFCQGNDSRLSDARTPLAHNQAWSTITATPTTLSGYGITDAQPLDSDLTSIAALTTTTFGRSFLDRADAAAGRSHLGLGTLATQSGTFSGTSSGTNTGDQTISSSSNATSHTVTLSASGGSLQLVEGSNITLTTTGTAADAVVTIAASGGGGSLTVQDEGTNLSTSVTTINFTGSGVTATGTSTVTVDIPGGGGISDGDKGDITVSGAGATWTIDNGAVTLAKQANLTTQRVIGRNTAGSGVPEEVSLSQLLNWASSTQGALITRGASGWVGLAPGLDGTFLMSGGAGFNLSYSSITEGDIADVNFGLGQFPTGSTTSADLRSLLTDETGTGAAYFQGGALATPASGTLTNCTGLPPGGITMATARLLGRSTAGSGAAEEISIGTNLTLSGGVLSATGGSASAGGSNTQVQFNSGGALAGAVNVEINSNNLQLTAPSSAPAAAEASSLLVYPVSKADRFMLAMRGPTGQAMVLQPSIFANNIMMWSPQSGTTGTGGNAFQTAWTSGGTVSHTAPAITNFQTRMRRTSYTNVVTTANQQLGVRMNTTAEMAFVRGNAADVGGFFYFARFGIGIYPGPTIRMFAGLQGTGATTAVCTSDTVGNHTVGLWHDTTDPASDSGAFNLVTRDGTTTTKTAINLANAIAANNVYDFMMYCPPNGTEIFYRLDDIVNSVSYTGSSTTTLPGNTTYMSPQCQMSNGTAHTAVNTVSMTLAKVYVESVY